MKKIVLLLMLFSCKKESPAPSCGNKGTVSVSNHTSKDQQYSVNGSALAPIKKSETFTTSVVAGNVHVYNFYYGPMNKKIEHDIYIDVKDCGSIAVEINE